MFVLYETIVVAKLIKESQGSVPCDALDSSPSLIPPKSVSATFQRVQDRFSCQFSSPSLSKSPESSLRVGSVSFASTTPLPLISSSPSSNASPSVLLFLGSLDWAGKPYWPLISIPSLIPSPSVSEFVGSVSSVNASWESFNPSLSVSALSGLVDVIPSVSAVSVAQPPGPIPK